jgi:hypothetical protein
MPTTCPRERFVSYRIILFSTFHLLIALLRGSGHFSCTQLRFLLLIGFLTSGRFRRHTRGDLKSLLQFTIHPEDCLTRMIICM